MCGRKIHSVILRCTVLDVRPPCFMPETCQQHPALGQQKALRRPAKKEPINFHPMFPKFTSFAIIYAPSLTTIQDRYLVLWIPPEIHKSEKHLKKKTFCWHKYIYEYHKQIEISCFALLLIPNYGFYFVCFFSLEKDIQECFSKVVKGHFLDNQICEYIFSTSPHKRLFLLIEDNL